MPNYLFNIESKKVKFIKTKYRYIKTKIPASGTKQILNSLYKKESRSMHGQLPIVWKEAKDCFVKDIGGNQFIDFTSTIFVTNTGHSNKRVFNYMKREMSKNLISSYAYANEIREKYISKLIKSSPVGIQKAFLLSSGTETTEAAYKLIKMYGKKIKKRRQGIICFEGNWHGRTLAAQMMSWNKSQKEWISRKDKDIHFLEFPYPWKLKNTDPVIFLKKNLENLEKKGINLKKDVAGFMLETFQGWGAIFYPKTFVKEIRKIANKNNILLAFDEMQAGFARTGKFFGFQNYDVSADIVCCGKGMGGGVPLSGVLGKTKVLDLPSTGNMSSTHSANPLCCAAGLAVLEEIEKKKLVKKAYKKGKILKKRLEDFKKKFPNNISHIFSKGLIGAILFKKKKNVEANIVASKIVEECMKSGLLVVHTGRESIKIGPPLTISKEILIEGLNVIESSIESILNKNDKN